MQVEVISRKRSLLYADTPIGATDANYDVDRSRLPEPHAGCVLEKVSVSAGKFITGGVTFGIGNRDMPTHVTRAGYIPKLKWLSQKFFVLWDEEEKRGWLVNGASALLHLVHASLEYNRTDKFQSAFLFRTDEMMEASQTHTANSAIKVLLNEKNRKLKIYPGNSEMYDEEMTHKNSRLEEVSRKKINYFRLEDRVEHYYDVLEKIVDHQMSTAGQSGIKLSPRLRKCLEGWDFKDLATEQDPLYPHVATLDTISKDWVDWARDIHAVTLLGRGFGDIIKPADTDTLCPEWTSLPKGKYYLAVCISDLKELVEIHGNPKVNPMKLSKSLVLYNSDSIFAPCQCMKGVQREHSDLVQVLRPSAVLHSTLPKADPISLEGDGALVFGQRDISDTVKRKLLKLPSKSRTRSHEGRVESSLHSSPAEGSEHPSDSTSQPLSSGAPSGAPLSTPPTSEAATSDGIELQVASMQAQEGRVSATIQGERQAERSKWRKLRFRSFFKS